MPCIMIMNLIILSIQVIYSIGQQIKIVFIHHEWNTMKDYFLKGRTCRQINMVSALAFFSPWSIMRPKYLTDLTSDNDSLLIIMTLIFFNSARLCNKSSVRSETIYLPSAKSLFFSSSVFRISTSFLLSWPLIKTHVSSAYTILKSKYCKDHSNMTYWVRSDK